MEALTLFNHAKDKRRPLLKKWITNYNVVHNKTWSRFRRKGHPRTEIPEIYPILASIVAWETDQSPQYAITPAMPTDSPLINEYARLAADLEWVLNTNYEALDYASENAQVLWDGELYGIGYGKTIWEATASDGLGDVMQKRVDPFNVYLDPDARSWAEMNYLFETRTCSRDEVRRRFPKARTDELNFRTEAPNAPTQLDPSGNDTSHRPNPGRLPTPTADSGTTNVTTFGGGGKDQPMVMDTEVVLIECWYRRTNKVELPPAPEDPTPGTPNRNEFADEWYVLVFAGDQILLHKRAKDVYGINAHPYSRYCPLEEGELYGYSLVEQLAPMQISINRLFASVEQNAWLSGNPILVQKDGRRTNITNRPGEKIEVNDPNQDVRWLVPPSISQQHIEVINKLIEEMERISGMSAIVRGSAPEGRPSEGVVNTVQDSAFVRIRQRLRNFERYLRSSALLQAALVTQFYDRERTMSRIGDDGEGSALKIMSSHFYTPGPEGVEPLKYNLTVRAGSSDAIGREARMAMYERMFALGVLPPDEFLKLAKVPGWHKIAQKVQAEKAAAGTLGMPPTQRAAARR